MDTRENNIAWWIAGILLVLLIIVGYLWISQKQDLNTVLDNGHSSIAAERDQINKDCNATDADSKARCNQDLSDLASILQDFSSNVQTSTGASTSDSMMAH